MLFILVIESDWSLNPLLISLYISFDEHLGNDYYGSIILVNPRLKWLHIFNFSLLVTALYYFQVSSYYATKNTP